MADATVHFLHDGGQPAAATFDRLVNFLDGAERTLDLAIYDAHFAAGSGLGERLIEALDGAERRGVQVRAVYNDSGRARRGPPPPEGPSLLSLLAGAVPSRAIPGIPDLMHHKYVIRDGAAVWTGSSNWTTDSWSRQENILVTVPSRDLAAAYCRNFEELWAGGQVETSGRFDDEAESITYEGEALSVRAIFSPGRGKELGLLVARRLGAARDRIRLCSPVLTSAPILATLAEVIDDGRCDTRITLDRPQMEQALANWRRDGRASWKEPLYQRIAGSGALAAKASTPWPEEPHDYMHAKVIVCDDIVLTGSYNCSHSGEQNAENVLEIRGRRFADDCAAFCEEVHARYLPPT